MRDDKFLDDYFNAEIKPTLVAEELKTIEADKGPSIEATQQVLNKYANKVSGPGNWTDADVQEMRTKVGKFKDAAQTIGTAMFTAPAELVQGAARLVGATDTADTIKSGVESIRNFQKENTPGSKFQLSKEAEDTAYGFGQAAAIAPVTGMGIAANTLGGAAVGLMQTKENDNKEEALRNAVIGGATAGVVTGALKGTGKVAAVVDKSLDNLPVVGHGYQLLKGKLAGSLGMAGTGADDVMAINNAIKKDINATYKAIGVPTKGMTPEQRLAHGKFISNFADDYNTQVSQQYSKALAAPAPDDLAAFVQSQVPAKTDAAVRKALMESVDPWDIDALANPESLLYYQQYQAALKNLPNVGPGATGLAKDIVNQMKKVSPDFVQATDMYKTHELLAKNINSNFYNAVQNDKTVIPAAIELIQKGGNGEEAIRQLFVSGFREQLVKNSNQPPLLQLSRSLGANPLQQQNTISFLRQTGLNDVADKYQGLVSLINTAEAAVKSNAANAKYLGAAAAELEPSILQEGINKILSSSSKWSDEFTNIMSKKQDALLRSEQLVNLIKRAGKSAGAVGSLKAARNLVNAEENAVAQSSLSNALNNNEDNY